MVTTLLLLAAAAATTTTAPLTDTTTFSRHVSPRQRCSTDGVPDVSD